MQNEWLKSILGEFQGYINEVKQNAQAQGINADFLDLKEGVLNHRAVVGEEDDNEEIDLKDDSPPTIYIIQDYERNDYEQIKQEVMRIYSVTNGLQIRVELKSALAHQKYDSLLAERNINQLLLKYRPIDAWVKVLAQRPTDEAEPHVTYLKIRQDGSEVRSKGYQNVPRHMITSNSWVTVKKTPADEKLANAVYGFWDTYPVAFKIAHEALHQFIGKANFYLYGIDINEEEKKKDDYGHFNDYPNLNMNAKVLGLNDAVYGKTVAEKIAPHHIQIITSFFWNFLRRKKYRK